MLKAHVQTIHHPIYGQRPIAYIDPLFKEERIITALQKSLPRFQHPDQFLPWPKEGMKEKMEESALQGEELFASS